MKSYFLWLNLNSTCSKLSFEVHNVSVAQKLKIFEFCSIQMTLLTSLTLEACSAQTIEVRKFIMEQKMMKFFISIQQKKKF